MKKLTRGESNIIKEGLNLYLEAWTEQIQHLESKGKRPLFSEGYAKQLIAEITQNIEGLTKLTK
jgi:hypothetical protein